MVGLIESESSTPLIPKNITGQDSRSVPSSGTAWEVVDWIHLAQVRGQWRTLVDIVINLQDA